MRDHSKLFFTLLLWMVSLTAWSQSTHYVNSSATGANNGSSWADAYTDLQDALSAAVFGDQVWVAAGTYYPTSTTDRNIYFPVPSGVQIYGGFPASGNPGMAQRDYVANPTYLSGDIGIPGDISDNSYRILIASRSDASTLLDGFTLQFANTNAFGGALLVDNDGYTPPAPVTNDIHVRNCRFEDCIGNSGTAVYITTGHSTDFANPVFENCVFARNEGVNTFQASGNSGGSLIINVINCTFIDNDNTGMTAFFIADAINGTQPSVGFTVANVKGCKFINNLTTQGSLQFKCLKDDVLDGLVEDCVFNGNTSPYSTGALHSYASINGVVNLEVVNSTFYDNEGGMSGAIHVSQGYGVQTTDVSNCIFWQNRAVLPSVPVNSEDLSTTNGATINISNSSLSSSACATGINCGANLYYNTAPGFNNPAAGDLSLNALSFAKDIGDNAAVDPSNTTDVAGNARIFNGTVDLGAYEANSNTPPCPRVIFVNQIASGANNGLNWSDAFVDLQDALAFARANSCVDSILVAEGSYKPHATDRNTPFELVNDIEMYGGFPNTGNPWFPDRDLVLHETILSGDIGTAGNSSDNSYVVVSAGGGLTSMFPTQINLNSGTLMHGFSITEGERGLFIFPDINSTCHLEVDSCEFYNNAYNPSNRGSAIYIGIPNGSSGSDISPVIRNTEIHDQSSGWSSAVEIENYITTAVCRPSFINCKWYNNVSTEVAAAAWIRGMIEPHFKNCLFKNNSSTTNRWSTGGGAVSMEALFFFSAANPLNAEFDNCLFHNNNGALYGGAVHTISYSYGIINANFNNCTFADNYAPRGSTVFNYGRGTTNIVMNNCISWGNGSATQGALAYMQDYGTGNGNLTFNNCLLESPNCTDPSRLFTSSAASTISCGAGMIYNQNPLFQNPAAGNYALQQSPASPAIDAGSNLLVPTGMSQDIAGNTRIDNGIVDMGCYENFSGMQLRPRVNINTTATTHYIGLNPTGPTLSAGVSGGTPPYTYHWSTGATTQSITVYPLAATSYSVSVEDANGLLLEDAITIFTEDVRCTTKFGDRGVIICYRNRNTTCVDLNIALDYIDAGMATPGPCLEFPEEPVPQLELYEKTAPKSSANWKVYPNPVSDQLHLDLQGIDYQQGAIYDSQGKQVLQWSDSLTEIPVGHLPAGMYLIRLHGAGKANSQRFMKN